MHEVERVTWEIVSRLMQDADPQREGWAIDAGLGQGDYYCEWTHNLGYKSLAIEPMPTETAIRACEMSHIPLVSAALGNRDGVAVLYSAPERDLRSLHGEVWGGMQDDGDVEVITLPLLMRQYRIERLTLLKLDIEGAEPDVIETLEELASDELPSIVCFEFGGEGTAEYKRGPWSLEQQRRVNSSFKTLHRLGYRWGVLVGSGDVFFVRKTDGNSNFLSSDNWGNAILARFAPSMETGKEISCLLQS